jgi:hypothetical protein
MYAADAASASGKPYSKILIKVDGTREDGDTLVALQKLAYAGGPAVTLNADGRDVRNERISLKLRAEKPNPKFDRNEEESAENPRYLPIDTPELRHRGLADQFYKEFSYWIRNARTVKFTVQMELIDLLNLDKTRKVTVGDVTGFIKKMQYTISVQTGLGPVTIEMLYL